MRLIKPYYEIESEIDGEKILRHIEKAARTCYKTEDKVGNFENTKKFIQILVNNGHHSTLEHFNISIRIIASRSFTHELVRHRLAAYSQECISGDVKVHKKYTVKELFDRQNGSNYDKTHNKTINLKSVNDNGLIIPNRFNKIFYKGIQDVYKITTKLGYTIKCTMIHKFKDENSIFKELFNFKIGDKLFVNGRPSLLKIEDEILNTHYLQEGLNPIEIAKLYKVPLSTIYNRLTNLGIFISHLNDKNKKKYNKNHTIQSYHKMKNNLTKQYKDGKIIIWNKGTKENENISVKKQADSLRKNHHNNGLKEKNSNWNGGIKGNLLASELKKEIKNCELCNTSNCRFEVHHIDKNIYNNDLENLIKCCNHCHSLLHHGWIVGKKEVLDIIESIDYVGKEETYDIEMKDPYHNYVANGFIVHNSTRYCNYSKDQFGNNLTFIIPPWVNISEGTYEYKDITNGNNLENANLIWIYSMLKAEDDYLNLLKSGWGAQQARMVLPNSLKTEIVMTCNIREMLHIFKLRTSKASHPEMREIMIPMLKEFQQKIPIIFDDIRVNE